MGSNSDLLKKYVEKEPPPPPPPQKEPTPTLYTSTLPGRRVRIRISEGVVIPVSELPLRDPKPLVLALKQRAVFKNPAYAIAQKQGRPLPKEFFHAFEEEGGNLVFPKGDLKGILDVFHRNRVPVDFIDATTGGAPPTGEILLRNPLPKHADGVFSALSGKRYGIVAGGQGGDEDKKITAHLISFHGLRTLIIVKRKWQLYAWRRALLSETQLTEAEIGLVGDGHKQVDRTVVIGIDRTLYQFVPQLSEVIGFLVVDQCDLVNVKIFFKLVWKIPARFLLGVATVGKRRDGLTEMMKQFLGSSISTVQPPEGSPDRPIQVAVEKTGFSGSHETADEAISAVCADRDRTRRIFGDLLPLVADGQKIIVVGPRIRQLQEIQALLMKNYRPSETITGQATEKEIAQVCAGFAAGDIPVVCCTTKTVSGLPIENADAVVVAGPFRSMDTASVLARMIRSGGMVYEYEDDNPALKGLLSARLSFWRKLKMKT